jgi:hypothetical protein
MYNFLWHLTKEDESNDDCLLSNHRSVSSSGAIPRKIYETDVFRSV